MNTTHTTAAMQPSMSRALALLATGHTIHDVAEHTGWPLGSIRALINGQKGWLLGADDRVSCPGHRGGVPAPDGVDPAHLQWARGLHQQQPAPPAPALAPAPAPTPAPAQDELTVVTLPLDQIHAHPRNVRADVGDITDLAGSIRAHGLLQPLTVRPHPTITGDYETIAGHRRHAASIAAGLTLVPCVIRPEASDAAVLEMMIIENVHRRGLNPIERAEALGQLRDTYGYSAAQIAERTGLNPSTISGTLALLDLAPKTRERVRRGELKVGDALKLVRRHRAKQRTTTGAGTPGATWEPDHFTDSHALARKAAALCQAREHTARRHLGNVACGQCWETVIRRDERIVVATEHEAQDD